MACRDERLSGIESFVVESMITIRLNFKCTCTGYFSALELSSQISTGHPICNSFDDGSSKIDQLPVGPLMDRKKT